MTELHYSVEEALQNYIQQCESLQVAASILGFANFIKDSYGPG